MNYHIELVDAPDEDLGFGARESQRTYKIAIADTGAGGRGKVETIRIRSDPDSGYLYIIENLVSAKWHRLLEGNTKERAIPFDDAILRAAKVLL